MSIIHDALKKVQENTNPKPAAQADSQAVSAVSSVPKEHSNNDVMPTWAFAALVSVLSAVVIVIFVIIFNMARATREHPVIIQRTEVTPITETAPQPPSITTAVESNEAPPQAAPAAVPEAAAEADDFLSKIKLQGIMQMGDKIVALINDNVYEQGQTIFGRKITTISVDKIIILDNGMERTLSVNPPKD